MRRLALATAVLCLAGCGGSSTKAGGQPDRPPSSSGAADAAASTGASPEQATTVSTTADREPYLTVPDFRSPKRPALVAFGHSFVTGDGAEPIKPGWPTGVAQALALKVDNRGLGGATSTIIRKAVEAYAPRRGDVVVIEAEMNDVRRYGAGGVARYKTNLKAMVKHLRAEARPKLILLVADPKPQLWQGGIYDEPGVQDAGSDVALAAYGRATLAVARSVRGVRFIDLNVGWDAAQNVSQADTLHPNKTGVDRMVAALTGALR